MIMGDILTTSHLIRHVEQMSTDIAVIKSRLEDLPIPSMQSDIQRNRHKIADLDKGLAALGERVHSIETKCAILHGHDK